MGNELPIQAKIWFNFFFWHSETLESESKEDKAVHVEVAAQGGDNHGNMSKSVVSYTHICNLFYVIVIVM